MSCKAAKFDPDEGRYYCDVSGDQCMYYIPNSEKCAEEYGEGPDVDDENEEKSVVELYKKVAFLAYLLREIICCQPINSNDMQALDNIIDDLPEVTGDDFRW